MELGRLPLGHNITSMENVMLASPEMPEISDSLSLTQKDSNLNLSVSHESSSSDNSDSDESDDESIKNEVATSLVGLVGKRRRSQPIKFQPSPIRPIVKVRTPKSQPPRKTASANVPSVSRKRGARCGNCPGCVREDCGKCPFCKDKPKFGGPGKKKQRCKLRTCSNFQHKKGGLLYSRFRKVSLKKGLLINRGSVLVCRSVLSTWIWGHAFPGI